MIHRVDCSVLLGSRSLLCVGVGCWLMIIFCCVLVVGCWVLVVSQLFFCFVGIPLLFIVGRLLLVVGC